MARKPLAVRLLLTLAGAIGTALVVAAKTIGATPGLGAPSGVRTFDEPARPKPPEYRP